MRACEIKRVRPNIYGGPCNGKNMTCQSQFDFRQELAYFDGIREELLNSRKAILFLSDLKK